MNGPSDLPEEQASRLEEAALWHMRLAEESPPSAAFLAWHGDPLNRAAFDAVSAGWNVFTGQDISPELIALRQAALASAGRRAGGGLDHVRPRQWRKVAAAIVLLGLMLGALWGVFLQGRQTYVTAFGERRVFTLVDGSRVSLDSDTRLTVHYTEHARSLRLDRGQARFDVAHDVRRPFTVTAGDETVIAVGTSFNVERLGAKVVITLIEGQVVVNGTEGNTFPSQPAAVPASLPLAAGEMMIASRGRKPAVMAANLHAATAWQNGMLILNDETLGDAVARINRYTDHPIVADASVSDLRVSGAFNATDIHAFVEAVTTYFPIDATVEHNGRVVLTRRPG